MNRCNQPDPRVSLNTTIIQTPDDIRKFFDAIAPVYRDFHGSEAELGHRLEMIRMLAGIGNPEARTLVDIGCGTGLHLFPLAEYFDQLVGVDLSPEMIAVAKDVCQARGLSHQVTLYAESAESLMSLADGLADVVICIGALEHMPKSPTVLRQIWRILKPGGVFVCLTPNGDWLWYRYLAPFLGIATHHLSTDHFFTEAEIKTLLERADFDMVQIVPWTFIPRGDMPSHWAGLLGWLDRLGNIVGALNLRGGLGFRAIKPMRLASGPGYRVDV